MHLVINGGNPEGLFRAAVMVRAASLCLRLSLTSPDVGVRLALPDPDDGCKPGLVRLPRRADGLRQRRGHARVPARRALGRDHRRGEPHADDGELLRVQRDPVDAPHRREPAAAEPVARGEGRRVCKGAF